MTTTATEHDGFMASTKKQNRLLKFRRTQSHLDIPLVIDAELPGTRPEEELCEDYKSYLISDNVVDEESATAAEEKKPPKDWAQAAKTHKEKGNSLFRISDRYSQAAKEYHRAIHCLRRAQRTDEMNAIRLQCYSNLAACDLEMQDYQSARKHTSKAIKIDPQNVKALYRRALARKYAAFDLDGAETDLLQALSVNPEDIAVKRTLEQLRRDRARSKLNETDLAKKMFSSTKS